MRTGLETEIGSHELRLRIKQGIHLNPSSLGETETRREQASRAQETCNTGWARGGQAQHPLPGLRRSHCEGAVDRGLSQSCAGISPFTALLQHQGRPLAFHKTLHSCIHRGSAHSQLPCHDVLSLRGTAVTPHVRGVGCRGLQALTARLPQDLQKHRNRSRLGSLGTGGLIL